MIARLFTDHPKSIGMSWAGHASGALRIGFTMIAGGIVCIVHALIPGLFKSTASEMIARLNDECHGRRDHDDRKEGNTE